MRVSSPSMAEAVIRGASEAGADVLELGLVGTEMVYFAVGELGLDGGIAVTASHNPKDYTGMKIVRSGALPVGGESGLLDIRDRALALSDTPRGLTPGQVQPYDIWEQFVERVLSFIDPSAVKPLTVVADAANGMAGVMLPPVLERLPQVEVVRCYFEPDGTFPNHEPNPLLPENREFIVRMTLDGAGRLRRGLRRRRRPLLLRRRQRRVRPRRLRDGAVRRARAGEGARREDHLRRARELGRARDDRARRRHPAREPRRARLHQAPHARGARGLRGRGLRPLLLPRLLPGRLGGRAVPAHARAPLEARAEALRDPAPVPGDLLHHGRAEHPGAGRRREAARSSRSASAGRARSATSTASRSTPRTGT